MQGVSAARYWRRRSTRDAYPTFPCVISLARIGAVRLLSNIVTSTSRLKDAAATCESSIPLVSMSKSLNCHTVVIPPTKMFPHTLCKKSYTNPCPGLRVGWTGNRVKCSKGFNQRRCITSPNQIMRFRPINPMHGRDAGSNPRHPRYGLKYTSRIDES